jgi:hypothetical protein
MLTFKCLHNIDILLAHTKHDARFGDSDAFGFCMPQNRERLPSKFPITFNYASRVEYLSALEICPPVTDKGRHSLDRLDVMSVNIKSRASH